jgi:predicted metal-dependent enzyme (double-stranded beta helix superfamily)
MDFETSTLAPNWGRRRVGLDLGMLVDMASELARNADAWQEHLVLDPAARTYVRLLATDEYDAWLLSWPPGASVTPHDHGDSVGAFALVHGGLVEHRWRGLLRWSRIVTTGQVVTMPKGTVHEVKAGSKRSLSLHVYSPPLATMAFYDEARRVVARTPVEHHQTVLTTPRVLHPAGRD